MSATIDLSIIIVSFNTKELTAQTIRSVFDTVGNLSVEVIVVDNNSTDGSFQSLLNEFGNKIHLIANAKNEGFAIANNEGLKISKGEYFLLLNSDTIVQPGALQKLLATARNSTEYGILSCSLLNPDHSYQPQGGSLPTVANLAAWWLWPLPGNIPGINPYQNTEEPPSENDGPITSGWVGGTVMLIRNEVYRQIGGLDEKIFMYAEDIDYCLRATHKNWKIGLVPEGKVIHIGNASGSSEKAKIGEIKGLLYIFSKYYSQAETLLIRVIFVIGALLRYLLFGILRGSPADRSLYWRILKLSLGM